MNLNALTSTSLSLFDAVGGWRTVAESMASRVLFLVTYLLTEEVLTAALVAVGGVLVFVVVRICTDRKYLAAVVELSVVCFSALLAGGTGHAANFYLPALFTNIGPLVVFLVSMLVRWPVIGLVVGTVRGERFAWRRDPVRRRRYQRCTAMFLAKFAIASAVMLPLYLAEHVTALGIANMLLTSPAAGVCVYVSWRILRVPTDPASLGSRCPSLRRHRGSSLARRLTTVIDT
ncbi:DUF3159 domain-containing protein [Stackebrandtia nassauensis]|uniref:DUF3159 domain-containing protein n=1 Tax=Stackebrandtia nassauensis (strain DSM 44728 / CIP 108903 / NRRL B-16338 / NBRC 102104 / LLR-40K-21) TaxID=446470 RepID=D3PUE9_STANL|nr:DUF3159 domain-containing protein [Stackebrandtia nassauensis]ADD42962.1 hypothetical protein Snas_3294 [Stackebrandtia nassauensis DSM 44728]